MVIQYVISGKRSEFSEWDRKHKAGDGELSADRLVELGFVEDWLRLAYSRGFKDEYPTVKSPEELEKYFRIKYPNSGN